MGFLGYHEKKSYTCPYFVFEESDSGGRGLLKPSKKKVVEKKTRHFFLDSHKNDDAPISVFVLTFFTSVGSVFYIFCALLWVSLRFLLLLYI